jgi:hypothetical protein
MVEAHREIASHTVQEGMYAIRLHGGPWDGKDVGVRDLGAHRVAIHGPRQGDHRIWITHVYERRGQRYEFVTTEVTPISACGVVRHSCTAPGLRGKVDAK